MPTTNYVYEDKGKLIVESVDHNGKYVEKEVGSVVRVTEIYEVFETGNYILELQYEYLGTKYSIQIPKEELKKNELLKYAAQGFPVNDSNAHYVIEYISSQETGKSPVLVHEGIGWDVQETTPGKFEPVFKGYGALGMKSNYIGQLPIKPEGKFEATQEFIRTHVSESPLSLAVAIGLSAALVGFLGDDLQCENLVSHFCGDSSTGKTSAAKLAVSMGSLPSFHSVQSLLNDYDGTENALLATLLGNRGFPACFDEVNMNNTRDFSQFIYRLASGRGKRRLTKEGKQKDIETYLTTIISTGEKNLTLDANQNTGKEIRVLQFNNIRWTNSADHAETVNSFVINHYGWPLLHLAKYLRKLGKTEVLKRYNHHRKSFIVQSLVNDDFTARLSGKYAFILTAAELANECMDLNLPLSYLLDILVNNEDETTESRDMAQKAYDYLLEQINVNIDKFSLAGINPIDAGRGAWGILIPQQQGDVFNGRKCTKIVCIAKGVFLNLLRDGKFENPKGVIKDFKERAWLDHDHDRNTRHRKITVKGTAIDVYALRIFKEQEDDLGEVKDYFQRKRPEKQRVHRTKSRKTPLLEESLTAILEDDAPEQEQSSGASADDINPD